MPLLLLAGLAGLLFLSGKNAPDSSASGMSAADVKLAVDTALATEKDPGALASFADSLEPDFHAFAVALEKKASALGGA